MLLPYFCCTGKNLAQKIKSLSIKLNESETCLDCCNPNCKGWFAHTQLVGLAGKSGVTRHEASLIKLSFLLLAFCYHAL